jgi:hypothetical protein
MKRKEKHHPKIADLSYWTNSISWTQRSCDPSHKNLVVS